ncbi:MAG: hypothetical protein WD185_05565, partial [Sneathiella sp.]
ASCAASQKKADIPKIPLDQDPELSFQYYPIWQPTGNVVNTYGVSTTIVVENSIWDISEVTSDLDKNTVALFDRLTLRKAQVDLHNFVQSGKICVFVIPVHFSTLNNKASRLEFLEICKSVPETYRKLLAWQIIKSNASTWVSQLSTAVSAIKPYGRIICLEVDISMPDFRDLKAMGVDVVGFNSRTASDSEQTLLPKLSGFCRRAELQGLKAYLEEISSSNMALHAVSAGFSFLIGPVIGKVEDQPGGIYELSFSQMYDKTVKKG